MAGPFTTNPNPAREVTQVGQRGGFDTLVPASSSVGAVANLLGTATRVIGEVEKDKAQEELRGKLGAVTKALQASKFPDAPEGDLLTAEGMTNPINKGAIKEMQRIVNAGMQGKLPQYAVVERVNVILNDAVSAAPEWRDELNTVAREMMGFSPQAEMMNQLLAAPKTGTKRLTTTEQWMEEADALGIPFEQFRQMKLTGMQNTLQKGQYDLLKDQGQYDTSVALKDGLLSAGTLAEQGLAVLQTSIASGKPMNVEQYKAAILTAKTSEMQRLVSGFKPGTDITVLNAAKDQLDQAYDGMLSLADNQDALTLLTKHNKLFVEVAKDQSYQIPGFGQVLAVLGTSGADAVMSALERFGDNPKAFEMFRRSGQEGSGAVNMAFAFGATMDSLKRMQAGTPPADVQQAKVDMWTLSTVLAQNNIDPAKGSSFVTRLIDVGFANETGNYGSLKSLANPRVVNNVTKSKEAHGAIINLYNSEYTRLLNEYDALAADGKIPKEGIRVEGNVIQATPVQGRVQSGGVTQAFDTWVRKMNNLNDFAVKYKSVGVLPASSFTTVANQVGELLKREKPGITDVDGSNPALDTETVVFKTDPVTGKPVRATIKEE